MMIYACKLHNYVYNIITIIIIYMYRYVYLEGAAITL